MRLPSRSFFLLMLAGMNTKDDLGLVQASASNGICIDLYSNGEKTL